MNLPLKGPFRPEDWRRASFWRLVVDVCAVATFALLAMLVLGLALALGCGAADDRAPFVGSWRAAETTVLSCPGQTTVNPDTADVAIERGTSSDLIRFVPAAAELCVLPLAVVSPDVAQLPTPHPCATSGGDVTIIAWQLTLTSPSSATETASGAVLLPSGVQCTFTLTSTLVRR